MWLRREFQYLVADTLAFPSQTQSAPPANSSAVTSIPKSWLIVQTNKQTYFQLFGIPETFQIDLEALAQAYRKRQGEWHPDRFAGQDEADKLRAVQQSSLLNQAFETLKNPLQRAGYLLALNGSDVDTVSQQDLGMELLMEQMQLREALDELPMDESALPQLEALKGEVAQKLERRQQDFAEQLQHQAVAEAKKIYHELQFLFKLLREIDAGEEQRLGY